MMDELIRSIYTNYFWNNLIAWRILKEFRDMYCVDKNATLTITNKMPLESMKIIYKEKLKMIKFMKELRKIAPKND